MPDKTTRHGARHEIAEVKGVLKSVQPKWITSFEPAVAGFHGSKTLWPSVPGHEMVWDALTAFLQKHG